MARAASLMPRRPVGFVLIISPGRQGGPDRMIANKDGGVSSGSSGFIARHPGSLPFRTTDGVGGSIDSASRWLVAGQHKDGYWVGELEGDTILESEYVLLLAFIGRGSDVVC